MLKERQQEGAKAKKGIEVYTEEKGSSIDAVDHEQKDKSKIYCANCIHCIVMKVPTGTDRDYVLRIRCAYKQWKKKLGEEKIYKFFTVARRTVASCEFYEEMGSPKEYLKELRKTLPVKDEIYTSQ